MGRRADLRLDDPRRRLVRDCETRVDVSEAMTHIATASLLIRRIGH